MLRILNQSPRCACLHLPPSGPALIWLITFAMGAVQNIYMTVLPILLALACAPATALAQTGHSDPIAPVLLGVTGILFFAVIGRYMARRMGQPTVLGELVVGIVLGNLIYALGGDFILVLREGTALFDIVKLSLHGEPLELAVHQRVSDPVVAHKLLAVIRGEYGGALLSINHAVDTFSRYGLIFLLFLVGLESSVEEMRAAGAPSVRVAVLGMVSPFLLGLLATRLFLPQSDLGALLFIGATLGATSVGITARVLQELEAVHLPEARVILGAAIVDDVLGLISLAVVTGIVVSGSFDPYAMLQILGLASLFVMAAFFAGPPMVRGVIHSLRSFDMREAKIFVSFIFVMSLAWFANLVGLATIIGAFAAGLILNDGYFSQWYDPDDEKHRCMSIKDLMAPLEAVLVPIFFVLIGLQVKLESFLDGQVLAFAAALTVAAVAGKLVSGYVAGRGINRLAVGIGMMPRGEVGLIFATIGKSLDVIDDSLFSSIVLMVVVTTLISPPLLKLTITGAARD